MIKVDLVITEDESSRSTSGGAKILKLCSDKSVLVSKNPLLLSVKNVNEARLNTQKAHIVKKHHFDNIYAADAAPNSSGNSEIYPTRISPIVTSIFRGVHGAVVSYGPTACGKSYNLWGLPNHRPVSLESRGLISRAVENILVLTQKLRTTQCLYSVSLTLVQIDNETLTDILAEEDTGVHSELKLREDDEGELRIVGAYKFSIENQKDLEKVLILGRKARQTSRSGHIFLTLHLDQMSVIKKRPSVSSPLLNKSADGYASSPRRIGQWVGKFLGSLKFVDLCGSELANLPNISSSNNKTNFNENYHRNVRTKNILAQRQCAAKCFNSIETVLSFYKRGDKHIPYRNSKVTHMLKDCIGKDAVCIFLICVSPFKCHAANTKGTIEFGSRLFEVTRDFRRFSSGGSTTTTTDKTRTTGKTTTSIEYHLNSKAKSEDLGIKKGGTLKSRKMWKKSPKEIIIPRNEQDGPHDANTLLCDKNYTADAEGESNNMSHQREIIGNSADFISEEGVKVSKKLWDLVKILEGLEFPKQSVRRWKAIKDSAVGELSEEIETTLRRIQYRFQTKALENKSLRTSLDKKESANGDLRNQCKTLRSTISQYERELNVQMQVIEGQKRMHMDFCSEIKALELEFDPEKQDSIDHDTTTSATSSSAMSNLEIMIGNGLRQRIRSLVQRQIQQEQQCMQLQRESEMWKRHYLSIRHLIMKGHDNSGSSNVHGLPSPESSNAVDGKKEALTSASSLLNLQQKLAKEPDSNIAIFDLKSTHRSSHVAEPPSFATHHHGKSMNGEQDQNAVSMPSTSIALKEAKAHHQINSESTSSTIAGRSSSTELTVEKTQHPSTSETKNSIKDQAPPLETSSSSGNDDKDWAQTMLRIKENLRIVVKNTADSSFCESKT